MPALAAAALACAALGMPATADARRASAVADAIWVAPWGDDRNAGTRRSPVRSLSLALAHADRVGRRTIYAMPGDHPRFRDVTRRSRQVLVTRMPGRRAPRIAGGDVGGGSDLRFRGVTFTDQVQLSTHPTRRWAQPARRIVFERSRFTPPRPFGGGACLTIRNGATTIRVRDSRFHECRFAITGPHDGISDPSQRLRSRDIVVERSWIGPVRTDGFQFAHWEDVTIRGNVIERQRDPYGVDHTDGIQITGNTERVRILDNVVSHGGQLVFVQEPFGWNRDLTIANNLVYETDNYAIKIAAVAGLRVIGNTVWRTRWGGLLLRRGVTGAVVANNALDGYGTTDSAEVVHRDHNFVSGMAGTPAPNEIVGGDPGFVDPARADFGLLPRSPLLGAADSALGVLTRRAGSAIGCTLPPRRSVAGRTMALPACGPRGG